MDENSKGNFVKEPFPEGENKQEPRKNFKDYLSFIWEIAKIALIALVIVVPIRYFLFQPFIVSGDSMVPNFHSGDYLIVDEIAYKFSHLQRGDVIVFNFPENPKEKFIKRVIGLPGETVGIVKGRVEIISKGKTEILNEKYLPVNLQTYRPDGTPQIEETTVKPGQYFVLGDNRTYSYDSRYWGIVPQNDIIGRVFLRIFPITAFSEMSHQTY